MKKIAIYPGSFDPITLGHIDILKRALEVFDEVIILVAVNPKKNSRFPLETKLKMIKESVKEFKNVKVDSYEGLTVEYAKKHNAKCLIRGLRAVSDFEYEFELSEANNFIDSKIDMVFFMARQNTTFISSSTVYGLYKSGVDISSLVPEGVIKYLK